MRFIYSVLFILSFCIHSTGQIAATVPGEVLIQIEPDQNPEEIEESVTKALGILPNFKLKDSVSEYMRIWLFSFDESQISKKDLINELNRTKGVVIAQANHIIESRLVPDDPFFGQQWHHVESGDHDIDSDLAWDITTGGLTATGDDIVVCVVEPSGAKWDHVDLIDNHWVNDGEIPNNGIDDDLNGYVDDYDGWNVANNNDNLNSGNHGTQVSSMIGSTGNNSTGVTGVNWNVKLMQVQIANVTEAGVIAAYTYPLIMRKLYNQTNGAKGAFVVATNSSWGTNNGQPEDAPLWCNMYDSLGTYGVISCGSTANNNVNVDVVGDLPTACPSDFLISVTATNNNDLRTFSGYGITTIDIGAPGASVYLAGASSYGNATGTSFASPCVAGAVGLLYSAPCPSFMQIAYSNPALAALNMINFIYDGVDPVESLADELVTGGRLNVKNSLDLIIESCNIGGCITPFALEAMQVPQTLDYQINWGTANDGASYNLRYRIEGSPTWITLNNIDGTSVTIESLLPCSAYEIQIMANCGDETTSEWTDVFTFNSEGCCLNPVSYTITDQNDTSVNLSWNNVFAATGYNLTVTPDGGSAVTYEDITTNNFLIPELDPCSSFEVVVTSICSNPQNAAVIYEINTSGCGSCDDLEYCTVSADASLEHIKQVTLGAINRISGSDGGYIKVEDQTTTLYAGQTYSITCMPGYPSSAAYQEYFKVWIDYNADGVFNQNTELVFDPGNTTNTSISGDFTVPSNISNGIVRMRVGMTYMSLFIGGEPMVCGANGGGEIEDYCVTLLTSVGTEESTLPAFTLYPNPANDVIRIQMSNREGQIIILDNLGKRWIQTSFTDNLKELDISALPSGIYHINLIGNNGEASTRSFIKQ